MASNDLSLDLVEELGYPIAGDFSHIRKAEFRDRLGDGFRCEARFFRLTNPTHMRFYCAVREAVPQGYIKIVHERRFLRINGVHFHYLEWLVRYKRDKWAGRR